MSRFVFDVESVDMDLVIAELNRADRLRDAAPELLDIANQFIAFGKITLIDSQTAENAYPEMFAAARAVVAKVTGE